jgi:hypothetical protein
MTDDALGGEEDAQARANLGEVLGPGLLALVAIGGIDLLDDRGGRHELSRGQIKRAPR